MSYNDIYKTRVNVFGNKPTPILKMAVDFYEVSNPVNDIKKFLDIGAGQGRDSLYMAGLGFMVQSIDASEVACEQLLETVRRKNITNINIKNVDIKENLVLDNNFDIISAINILHLVDKEIALNTIDKMKKSVKNGGIVVISSFVFRNGFIEKELLKLFDDFDVLRFQESLIDDPGHPGQPEKHTHFVSRIIAKRK